MIESWTIKRKLRRFLKNKQMFRLEIFHKINEGIGIRMCWVDVFLKNNCWEGGGIYSGPESIYIFILFFV